LFRVRGRKGDSPDQIGERIFKEDNPVRSQNLLIKLLGFILFSHAPDNLKNGIKRVGLVAQMKREESGTEYLSQKGPRHFFQQRMVLVDRKDKVVDEIAESVDEKLVCSGDVLKEKNFYRKLRSVRH